MGVSRVLPGAVSRSKSKFTVITTPTRRDATSVSRDSGTGLRRERELEGRRSLESKGRDFTSLGVYVERVDLPLLCGTGRTS